MVMMMEKIKLSKIAMKQVSAMPGGSTIDKGRGGIGNGSRSRDFVHILKYRHTLKQPRLA